MSQVTGVHHPEPGVCRRRLGWGWRGACRHSHAGPRPWRPGAGRGGRIVSMPPALRLAACSHGLGRFTIFAVAVLPIIIISIYINGWTCSYLSIATVARTPHTDRHKAAILAIQDPHLEVVEGFQSYSESSGWGVSFAHTLRGGVDVAEMCEHGLAGWPIPLLSYTRKVRTERALYPITVGLRQVSDRGAIDPSLRILAMSYDHERLLPLSPVVTNCIIYVLTVWAALLAARLGMVFVVTARRRLSQKCSYCGYSICGQRCPECGAILSTLGDASAAQRGDGGGL